MNFRQRALVLGTLVAIVASPIAALHPLTTHVFDSGGVWVPKPMADAAVVAVFILIGATIVPSLGLARVAMNWLRGSGQLRGISLSGRSGQVLEGIDYVLLDAPQVVFFTAGIIRPRIYATTGAAANLAPGAFRAALLHESSHKENRDVAWRAALAAIERAFAPSSSVRKAVRSLSLETEMAADRAAVAAGANRADLFEAMVAAAGAASVIPAVGLTGSGTLQRLAILADASVTSDRPDTDGLVVALAALTSLPFLVHTFFWLGAVCF